MCRVKKRNMGFLFQQKKNVGSCRLKFQIKGVTNKAFDTYVAQIDAVVMLQLKTVSAPDSFDCRWQCSSSSSH